MKKKIINKDLIKNTDAGLGMIALSVRQPYAELIISGKKRIEYRSKATKKRGTVLLYASKKKKFKLVDDKIDVKELKNLPTGLIIGTIDIVDCVKGNNGYEWLIKNAKRWDKPLCPIEHPQPVWFYPFGKSISVKDKGFTSKLYVIGQLVIQPLTPFFYSIAFDLIDRYVGPIYHDGYHIWRKKLVAQINSGEKRGYITFVSGVPAGILIYQNVKYNQKKAIEIKTFFVIKHYRKTQLRVGSNLLKHFTKQQSKNSNNILLIEVKYDTYIKKWLVHKGFKIVNSSRNHKWLSFILKMIVQPNIDLKIKYDTNRFRINKKSTYRKTSSSIVEPIRTQWNIVTGAPRSGKSSVLSELANLGFQTHKEIARSHIQNLIDSNIPVEKIFDNQLILQRNIIQKILLRESSVEKDEIHFFDRGLPDGIGFYKAAGLDTDELMPYTNMLIYKNVFFLEKVPLEYCTDDPLRPANENDIDRLSKYLYTGYKNIGYNVISVPFIPLQKRIYFILSKIFGVSFSLTY